ncbi:MAG: transcriptional repressor LexA [Pseudomonadota bacterium]
MVMSLTPIQRKILAYIEREIAEGSSSPTLRAICAQFGFSAIGTVQDHLKALIQKGFLEKDPRKARGIRLASRHRAPALSVPILGAIAAGLPREAVELALGSIPVPSRIKNQEKLFALRVSGESMSGAGICDGDLVVARQQNTARHGDIVVALVDGQATVKRFYKKGGKVRLVPENPDFSSIEILSENSAIQGKVVSVQRYYE